jgi:hypothetical protein
MKSIAGACVVVALAIASSSGQQQPRVTGFFTDMHSNPGSGDVAGTEVWIVYARGKFYATVQDAGGEPDPPVVLPVEVSGSRIKFTTQHALVFGDGRPAPDLVLNYTGTVTRAGLAISLNGSDRTLKRGNSYWQ